MKKFVDCIGHGIIGSLVLLIMGGMFIGFAYLVYLGMIHYNLGVVGTLFLFFGILGFTIGIITYLDDNDEEGKNTEL